MIRYLRCEMACLLPNGETSGLSGTDFHLEMRNLKKKITRNYIENQVQAAPAKAVGESSQGT